MIVYALNLEIVRMITKREELKLTGLRIEPSSLRALAQLARNDPERATVSTLIRRAVREYLERQAKK
jgi:hypothetical protein